MAVAIKEHSVRIPPGTYYTHEEILKEWKFVLELIKDTPSHVGKDLTPKEFQKSIKRYHQGIISLLDSGIVIGIPSELHRQAHQYMWVEGHMLYDRFGDFTSATVDFVNNGRSQNLREKFDVWYAKKYIFPAVEQGISLSKQITAHYDRAKIEAIEFLHHPLEKIAMKEFGN